MSRPPPFIVPGGVAIDTDRTSLEDVLEKFPTVSESTDDISSRDTVNNGIPGLGGSTPPIQFFMGPLETRIISLDTPKDFKIEWEQTTDATIKSVDLTTDAPAFNFSPVLLIGVLGAPSQTSFTHQQGAVGGNGSATFPPNAQFGVRERLKEGGLNLFFRINWENIVANKSGIVTSGAFTVFTNASAEESRKWIEKIGNDQQLINGGPPQDPTGSGIDGNNSGFPTTTATPGRPTPSGNQLPSGNLGESASGGSSGLSKGAIAGIAVGAVLFLLALGAIAFLLFRRRRRSKDHVVPYDVHSGHEYMTEKETNARVAESPHSPYSDDGLARNSALLHNPDGVPAVAAVHDRSYAPYTDSGPPPPVDGQRSLGARAETPQAVSSAVAHLVEDGMTDDQIRRLEEEERALDRAIEQAGRRS